MEAVELATLTPGEKAIVLNINGGKRMRDRLMELGLIEGARLNMVNNCGGPVIITVGNSRFAIGKGIASKIMVESI